MWGYIRYFVLFILLVFIGMVSIHLYHDNRLEDNDLESASNLQIQSVIDQSNQEEAKGEVKQEEDSDTASQKSDNSSIADVNEQNSSEEDNSSVYNSQNAVEDKQDTVSQIDPNLESSDEEEYFYLDVRQYRLDFQLEIGEVGTIFFEIGSFFVNL